MSSKEKNAETSKNQYPHIIEQLKAIINYSGDGIFVTDGKGKTLMANPAYEKISGIMRHEVEGKNVYDLVENKFYTRSIVLEVLEKKTVVSAISYVPRIKKELMATGTPVFDSQGNIILVVCSVRDVTHLKQLEWELQSSKALNEQLNRDLVRFEDTVFLSPRMLKVIEYAKQVAKYPTSILIQGDTGTGKEVIADFIFQNSERQKKPFVKINCGSIPEPLLESELFGYEPGAFTGAQKKGKPGLLEIADGGTVFLDEVGELPLGLQVKLLRALQVGEITKLGGVNTKKIDIRVISATNKDLAEMIKENKFREDLFYRLNVIQIDIPRLAQRREDILPLIEFFLDKFSKRYKLDKRFSQEALDCFVEYHWPGNIRELKNLVENLVVSVMDDMIDIYHLPGHMGQGRRYYPILHRDEPGAENQTGIRDKISKRERDIITDALEKERTLRGAAKILGISHSTLSRKMKKLNMHI